MVCVKQKPDDNLRKTDANKNWRPWTWQATKWTTTYENRLTETGPLLYTLQDGRLCIYWRRVTCFFPAYFFSHPFCEMGVVYTFFPLTSLLGWDWDAFFSGTSGWMLDAIITTNRVMYFFPLTSLMTRVGIGMHFFRYARMDVGCNHHLRCHAYFFPLTSLVTRVGMGCIFSAVVDRCAQVTIAVVERKNFFLFPACVETLKMVFFSTMRRKLSALPLNAALRKNETLMLSCIF